MDRNGMDALDKHFKQWKQISDRLQGQLGPVLEAQRALEKAMSPTLELQEALKSPLEPFFEEQRRLQKAFEGIKLPTYNLPDLSPFTKQIQQYQRAVTSKGGFSYSYQSWVDFPVNSPAGAVVWPSRSRPQQLTLPKSSSAQLW